jgi:hypothetical protein
MLFLGYLISWNRVAALDNACVLFRGTHSTAMKSRGNIRIFFSISHYTTMLASIRIGGETHGWWAPCVRNKDKTKDARQHFVSLKFFFAVAHHVICTEVTCYTACEIF